MKNISIHRPRIGHEKVVLTKSQMRALEIGREAMGYIRAINEISDVHAIKKVRVIRGGHVIDRYYAK